MEWSDEIEKRRWSFEFQLIDPKARTVIGSLDDVDITSVSVTESYYTDTRVQAKLTYIGKNPNRFAFIRIVAKDAHNGDVENLGTFIPADEEFSIENGVVKTTVSLESTLYAVSQKVLYKNFQCISLMNAYTHILNAAADCGIPITLGITMGWNKHGEIASVNDVVFSHDLLCVPGKSYLELIYGICNATNNRLDVNGEGVILINKYIAPSSKEQTVRFALNVKSSNSVVHHGITYSSNYMELPNEYAVYCTKDEQTVGGSYKNNSDIAKRGYTNTKIYSLTEMEPFTNERAAQLAKAHYGEIKRLDEWQLTMEYQPIYTGDVGTITGLDGEYEGQTVKVFIKNREVDLASMTQKLTLKLASANDTENGE